MEFNNSAMLNHQILLDYEQILQYQTTAILVLDDLFAIQYLNESGETFLNTSLRRAFGLSFDQLMEDQGQLLSACAKSLAGGNEIRLRNHGVMLPTLVQERRVDCVVNRIGQGEQLLLMVEMTELDGATKLLREEELAQRQLSNQAMIRGLAHEIRNPLGGIRGAAQLLAEESGNESLTEYSQIIIQEVDRLTNLVKRMQAQTRARLDQPINIHDVIEYVRQLVLADGNPEFKIVQDYDPSLPSVKGNRELLIQALMNIIQNAAEAIDSIGVQGEIVLRTRADHQLIDSCRRQVVRIDIQDNGPGIEVDLQPRIFDHMVTGKLDGTGLGLPIAAEIISQHEGSLDFYSISGCTTFHIYLPLSSASNVENAWSEKG